MTRAGAALSLLLGVGVSQAAGGWCLGMGGLGGIRVGMTVDDVLRQADFPGLERHQATGDCWYLPYKGRGNDFQLMIIQGQVARIEVRKPSRLRTLAGAGIGSSEEELRELYGARLDVQPHKYEPKGHVFTLRSSDGSHGLRFESADGKVIAIQAGPWEHLNYVEGCG